MARYYRKTYTKRTNIFKTLLIIALAVLFSVMTFSYVKPYLDNAYNNLTKDKIEVEQDTTQKEENTEIEDNTEVDDNTEVEDNTNTEDNTNNDNNVENDYTDTENWL